MSNCFPMRFVGLIFLLLISGCASEAEEDATPPEKTPISSSVDMTKSMETKMQLSPRSTLAEITATSVLDTINLATMAELRNTTQIEVCRLDCASYTPFLTIKDADLITALVKSLDTDIPLRPHARCPAVYQLHFTLRNGQHHYFGYTCEMMSPTFLRGNQEFWGGRDAIAPDAFNELLLPLIAPTPSNGK